MSIRRKLSILISILLVSSIGNSVFVYVLENESETKLRWVTHTHDVILHAHALLMALSDAETGQRGYLLTSESQYLEPYGRGINAARMEYSRLKQLTIDNSAQQQRLLQLEKLINNKLAELAQTIALHDTEPQKALEIVTSDLGKNYMDAIRQLMVEFETEEKWLLEERKAHYLEARAYVTSAIIIQVSLIIILIIALAIIIKQQLFDPLNKLITSITHLRNGNKPGLEDFLPNNEMGFVVSNFYEMSEVVYNNQIRLARQAKIDTLTGVRNRRDFELDVNNCLASARSKNELIALCMIDLDGLKATNDSLGHDTGDKLLLAFAERSVDAVRETDMVCRSGGDEFILVLTQLYDEHALHTAVEKVISKIRGQIHLDGTSIPISFSTGVAVFPDHANNAHELVQLADSAMYQAKRERMHGVVYFKNPDGVGDQPSETVTDQ